LITYLRELGGTAEELLQDLEMRGLLLPAVATSGARTLELMRDALARLSPVLRALDGVIGSVTSERGSA